MIDLGKQLTSGLGTQPYSLADRNGPSLISRSAQFKPEIENIGPRYYDPIDLYIIAERRIRVVFYLVFMVLK